MLQNRVDPSGNLIITPARGAWMGNRGVIHDERQHITRLFRLKAWLICVLEFKDRRRRVMAPHRYTELFFLDEATAFSAGHRPCAECRRKAFTRFKSCWILANPEHGFTDRTPIWKIDEVLHKERINRSGVKLTHAESAKSLPNGSMVLYADQPGLVLDGQLYPWTPSGYGEGVPLPSGEVRVLTPASVVRAFRMGYVPQMAVVTLPVPL
ncbi:MAG TPA: hypothetical protein VN616_11730 [Puia sp.]|nr:hypothetical protein [Puia sp.]